MNRRHMILLLTALLCLLFKGRAQRLDLGLEQTTELQSNFQHVKAIGLLETSLDFRVCSGLTVEAHTLTVLPTSADPMLDDLQGFSNIDADPIPLTLSLLSLNWATDHTSLKAGLRNLNSHYFATDGLSLFTHSSHGIPPTLSANLPVANYPTASLGLDFQLFNDTWQLDASLYNGVGYSDLPSQFRLSPKEDGLFGALQLSHQGGYGSAHIGFCGWGMGAVAAETGQAPSLQTSAVQTGLAPSRPLVCALWAYTELNLGNYLCLIPQYSRALGPADCHRYAALAITATIGPAELGLAETIAWYTAATEYATELTASIELSERVTLQPALHLIHCGPHPQHTPSDTHLATLLRLTLH